MAPLAKRKRNRCKRLNHLRARTAGHVVHQGLVGVAARGGCGVVGACKRFLKRSAAASKLKSCYILDMRKRADGGEVFGLGGSSCRTKPFVRFHPSYRTRFQSGRSPGRTYARYWGPYILLYCKFYP